MKTFLLPLALSLSVPAFAGSSALEALRAEAGVDSLPSVTAPAAIAAGQEAQPSDISSLGAAVIAAAARKSVCDDGSDLEVHGAPMCSLALSNDPSEQHYIYTGIGSRERGENFIRRREIKLFAIGMDALVGVYVPWAVESRDLVLDPNGAVISAKRTIPEICASAEACPGRALQPYRVRDASGAEKTVLIGRRTAPMTELQIREELEITLAAIRAK